MELKQQMQDNEPNLAQSTVEDECVLAFNLLNEIRNVIGETVACKMQGSSYVSIIATLIIPSECIKLHHQRKNNQKIRQKNRHESIIVPDIDDGNVRSPPQREKLRASYVGDTPRHFLSLILLFPFSVFASCVFIGFVHTLPWRLSDKWAWAIAFPAQRVVFGGKFGNRNLYFYSLILLLTSILML